jgi:outer membrane receptor protein involved in Fe transport
MGFAFERMQYNVLEQLSPNGRMNTYSDLPQLLANTPKQLNALAPGHSNPIAIRESLFAGYVQDDWRFRPNITLNIGLRYEMTTLPNDANNRIEEITTLTNCATPGVAPSPSSPCGPVHVGSFIAGNPTTKNLEPRIGFSWDPFKNGKTAVRGGFGMFDVLPLPYEFGLNAAATAPYQIIGLDRPGGSAATGKCVADPCKGATLGGGIDNNVGFSPNAVRNRYVEQNPKRAYVMNWNFNIQREIAPNLTSIIGYVGSRSLHLSVAADDINLVPPVMTSAGLLIPKNTYQLDPNWGGANGGVTPGGPGGAGIRPVIFDGEATYHGLQAQLKRSMGHGVQGQLSYTFSKCRDTSSAPVTGDTYVNSIAVPLLLSKQYRIGACDFDLRHVLVGTFLWDVPGPKSGMASYVAGGWELGAIVTAESGSPYSVTVGGGNDPLGTGFNGDFSMDYADLISGCNATPGVTRDAKGIVYAFNPNCFGLPQSTPDIAAQCTPFVDALKKQIFGTCANLVGHSGRNRFYGPGLTTVDFSAFKNFQFTERLRLQFRAEFFNLLNHANFAAPNFLNDANNSVFDDK